jgi:5-methylcytosine-specific restriction protein B
LTSQNAPTVRLTPEKVRKLSVDDLELKPLIPEPASPAHETDPLPEDDPILQTTLDLLTTYGGVIYVGPPGTSKSWYAARVALTLTNGDSSRVRFVQFHPSYQYEDFVEGFVPRSAGGFELAQKHLLQLCDIADGLIGEPAVLVIDELSRGDPGRVFGEALTYLERSKRGLSFNLASGTQIQIPENLIVLATMNALDRGVDEVDAALDRRFAKVGMDPNEGLVERFLVRAGMTDDLRDRVLAFFVAVNNMATSNPYVSLGHTYFQGIAGESGLRRLWEHQLRFHFDKAFRLDPQGRRAIDDLWNEVLAIRESSGVDDASQEPFLDSN